VSRRFRRGRRSSLGFGLVLGVVLIAGCASPSATPPPTPAPALPVTPVDPSGPVQPPSPVPGDLAPGLPSTATEIPALRLVEVARVEAPTDTAVLPDGTVLVAERAGIVRVLFSADGARASDGLDGVLIDLSDRTTTDSERGLLAIAVSPDGGELFLSMTDLEGDTLIEAHPLRGTDPAEAPRSVYALPQPRPNHNGGAIVFAPDGVLLVGLGDGGGAGDPDGAGQDRSTPLGSVLRLDVRSAATAVPSDNPFVGREDIAGEIAAYGLRNPWRISLDAARGELWIADIGQSSREELNRVTLDELLGANFGWALREGTVRFLGDEPDDHTPPVHDYEHGPGCSVTGGHVYRGSAIPELVGAYVFSDYCDGEVRALFEAEGPGPDRTVNSRPLGVAGERIVGFGVDAQGELLVLELGGRLLRLVRG
jgi:glucose/arabinose dehydrogenase